jgi:HlyD family type I secretion membrane fusion protein
MPTAKKRSQEFTPRRYVIAGYATIFVVFGVFGTWAATAPLASAVVAGGTVSVESNRKTIQHLEGGIISKISVEEGDLVEAGDVLIELDATQAQGNFSVMRARLALLQATEARLLAESIDADEIIFPDALLDSEEEVVKSAVNLQQTLFRDRKTTKDNEVAILKVRIEQLHGIIKGLETQLGSVNKQFSSVNDEVSRLQEGNSSGAVSTNRVSQMTREMLEYEGKQGELLAEISKLKQTISETELQIVQARQQYIERGSGEMRDVSDQLSEVHERFRLASDILNRTVIRSPVRGIVQNVRVHTTNGIIRPAEPIVDVIPIDDNLVVIAQVNPIDIDNISAGSVAEVRFPAFSSKTTPTIFGKVIVISKDVVEPTRQGEVPHYEARVEVDDKDVPFEIRGKLLPGMPAEVIVPTGERTLAQYIVKPLTDSFHKSLREE